MFTSSAVGPAVKTEEGETGSLWDGGDPEVIKLVVTASHTPGVRLTACIPRREQTSWPTSGGYGMRTAWRGAAEKGDETRRGSPSFPRSSGRGVHPSVSQRPMPTSQDRGNVGRGQSNESMRLESGTSCRLLVGWFSGEVGAWVRYSDPLPAEECGNPNNWARYGSRRHKRIVSSQTFHSRLPAFDDMAIMDLSTGLIRQVDRRLLSSTFCWQAPRLVTRCGTGDIASQPMV